MRKIFSLSAWILLSLVGCTDNPPESKAAAEQAKGTPTSEPTYKYGPSKAWKP
jgi:hypothetical protein